MIRITGLGIYLPQGRQTAAQIAEASGVPEWVVREKMGLDAKPVPGPEDHTNAMGIRAAEAARTCGRPDAARKLGNLVTALASGWDKDARKPYDLTQGRD